MNIVEQIKEKLAWGSIASISYKSKKKPTGLLSWNSIASVTVKPKRKVKRGSKAYRSEPFEENENIEVIRPYSDLDEYAEPNVHEEDFDEEDELDELFDIQEPLTVRDYKLIYYYRTMTLIITLLVMLLIFVIYMVKNDMTVADLIPDKIQAIYTSRYFHKIISLLKGMK